MTSHLFLTGATGALGRRWLPRLLEGEPARRVTLLLRDPAKTIRHPRVTVRVGDLRLPQLGLCRSSWAELAATLTDIVHCGADVRFTQALEEARAVNATGTQTMLDLARAAKHLTRFAHISTAYVMGRDAGDLPESRHLNRRGFMNTYQHSKYEAEQLVFASMPAVPAAVFRLSSVIREEGSYLQQTLRLIPRNPFPFMPGASGARIDLIDHAWAVAALSRLFERQFRPGAVYHICAGQQGSIGVPQLVDMSFSAMNSRRRPAMVSLEAFEQFAADFLQNGSREIDKLILRSILSFLPHLALEQTFLNQSTSRLLQTEGILPADSVTVTRNMLARVAADSANGGVPACEPVR